MGKLITSRSDLDGVEGFETAAGFLDYVSDKSDMEVYFDFTAEGIVVEHYGGGGQPQVMHFAYPFDSENLADWVYHVENDCTLRWEALEDIGKVIDLLADPDSDDPRRPEVEAFLNALIWDRTIDLDGTDLLVLGDDGLPVELSGLHEWVTPYVGAITRPYRPHPLQPTVARLYTDGTLALTWAPALAAPEWATLILDDLLVVDLNDDIEAWEVTDLYDRAHARFTRICPRLPWPVTPSD